MLVSQIERSGGTLLSRLFDGHPECHAHPQGARDRTIPKKKHWPPIDLDRPESWFEMLHEAHVGKYRRKGYWSSKQGGRADSVPLLDPAPADDLRYVRRRPEHAQRARRPRLLLHLLFQRVAGQPQPLHRPEEGRHRLRSAAEPEPRQGRAILRRLSGRDAHLHRAGSLRLVRCRSGGTAHANDDVEGALGLWRRVGRGRRSRRTSGAPNASSSSCTRPSCATPRPRCGASPIESGSPCPPRSSSPPSTAGRSRQLELRRSTGKAFCRSARKPGARASTRRRRPASRALSDDLYERAQSIAQS